MHELIYDIIMLCAINGNVLSSPTHSFSLAFRLRFYENYMARTERITMYYHAVHFCRPLCSAIVCGKDRRKERREKEREKRIKRILLKLWMILLSLDSTVISLQIIMSRGSCFFHTRFVHIACRSSRTQRQGFLRACQRVDVVWWSRTTWTSKHSICSYVHASQPS